MSTKFRINVNRLLFVSFVFWFMFSNLISRILGVNINFVFYFFWICLFVYSLKFIKWNPINLVLFCLSIIFIAYISDPRTLFKANIFTIKDFIIPILSAFLGYALSKSSQKKYIFDDINKFYFLFIFYGIFQQICFYTGNLERFLPWDAYYVQNIIAAGPSNILQPGGLLRFFGTMNSFVEFQVATIFLGAFLWLDKEKTRKGTLLYLNIILAIIFMVLSLERSPIMMGVILIFVWQVNRFLTNPKVFFGSILIIGIISLLVVFNQNFLKTTPLTAGAYQRFYNVLTFNLKNDAAVSERGNVQWKQAFELAKVNLFGIGPGRLSPGAADILGNLYVGPHNNFLAIYLAYGMVGFILFISLLLLGIWQFTFLKENYQFFGYGLITAFIAMGMFNLPFAGKQGIIFFMIFGFINGQENKIKYVDLAKRVNKEPIKLNEISE